MSIRAERVATLIQQEVADLLNTEFREITQSLVTVTDARATSDLSIAYVYVSILGATEEERQVAFSQIETSTSEIRSSLASRIRHQVRSIPDLRFILDESLERAQHIEELLEKARAERMEREESQSNDQKSSSSTE
jgi:ribosome-binding factor A